MKCLWRACKCPEHANAQSEERSDIAARSASAVAKRPQETCSGGQPARRNIGREANSRESNYCEVAGNES
jgi:hypothetical protein